MQIRPAGATALYFLLLFPLLLDAAWNELLCCDHESEHQEVVSAADAGIHMLPADEEHEEDCLCCGLCSQRVSLDPESSTDATLRVAEVQALKGGTFLIKPRPASHPGRGPPTPLSLPIS